MTSLREEIEKYIDSNPNIEGMNVDEILKIFEKRIDYVIDRLDPNDDRIKISALKQVKEMLGEK